MGKYMMMIYDEADRRTAADEAALAADHAAHGRFGEAHGDALRGGAELRGPETATCIRYAGDGSVAMTDGTFVETKEVLGGFYLIEAADLDEALAIAREVPAPFGGVEVRPVVG